MRHQTRNSKRVLLAALAVGVPTSCFAQAQAQAPTAGSESMPDIVVTAQKRNESINTVPISISAATQAQLDAKGLKNIDDLIRTTPGLAVQKGGALDDIISIRGITSNVGASTTAVYVDETPVSARNICFYCGFTAYPQLFDLERVEVLRGPQGTLFGASSMGGTIRFITPKPDLEKYTGYARAEVSTTEHGAPSWELGAAIGGPIVEDKVAFRASGWTRLDGGYIDAVDQTTGRVTDKNTNQRRSYVARLAVTVKPAEQLTITPSFYYQKMNVADRDTFWPDAGTFRSYMPQLQPYTDRQIIGALDATYDAGSVTIKSVTSIYNRKQERADDYTLSDFAYFAGTDDRSALPNYLSTNYQNTSQKNFTQELRASTNGTGPFSFTGGFYFNRSINAFQQASKSDFDLFSETFYGGTAAQIFGFPLIDGASYREKDRLVDKEYAVFGEVSYKLANGLKASLGARVSHNTYNLTIDTASITNSVVPTIYRSGKATPVTPRASLSYQHGRTLFYATAAKGFRIGGGNTSLASVASCAGDLRSLGFSDVPGSYKSDSLWSYEAGAKRSFAGGRGSIGASAFWVDWKNIQTNILLPTCGYNYTGNVGKARVRGFDMEGSFRPFTGLTLNGSVAYTDAVNLESVVVNGSTVVSAGSKLQVPDWSATVGAEYTVPLGIKNLYLRGDYQFANLIPPLSQPGDLAYDPVLTGTGAINFASLRTGVRARGLDISLFVNNIFNDRPSLGLGHELRGLGNVRNVTLRPRTFGLTGTFRY